MNFDIKYRNILIVTAGLVLLSAASCKKFIDLKTPVNSVSPDNAFVDSSTATSVILGLYSGLVSQNQTGGTANTVGFLSTALGAMSADEAYSLNASFDAFRTNTLAANTPGASVSLWNGLYIRIARANYAIAGISAATNLSAALKNQLLGEAKFIRAWCYFYLVNFWGKSPLVLSTDALTTGLLPGASVEDVYKQIVQDLTEAKAVLKPAYPSTERARANVYVVSAFLARVYFYQQNWPAAETEATNVIGSNGYGIVMDLNNVFLNNSNETIWQSSLLGSSGIPQTIFGSEFLPSGTTPTYVLYDTLANTFEEGDQRKVNWTQSISYLSKTYYYPYKYKVKTTSAGKEYPILIRLSEMYLIRAEARANQDKLLDAQADLKEVRQRAGLTTTAETKEELLAALEHERWVELFTEFSDRWFNLKRLNKATAVLSKIKPDWKPFQQLYPIPPAARKSNPNLDNNPEYEDN